MFLIFKNANSQNLSGVILDSKNNEALPGVNISSSSDFGTASDLNGKYNLPLIEGKHVISFKFLGYREIKKEIILSENETKILNIFLEDEALKINTCLSTLHINSPKATSFTSSTFKT